MMNNEYVIGHGGGGNFNRGGHMSGNNFRGGGGGGNRTSNSNDSHFGPMRNGGNFRQQRNAPYSKGPSQQSQSFDGPSHSSFKNKFNQGGGSMSHNDFHAGNSGGASGGSQRGGRGPSSNIGQDRRGFALPAVEHQPSFGAKPGRFGSGSMVPTASNADSGMFQRNRNNPGMNRYDSEHN